MIVLLRLGKIIRMWVMVRCGETVEIIRLLRSPPGLRLRLTQLCLLLPVKLLRVVVGL